MKNFLSRKDAGGVLGEIIKKTRAAIAGRRLGKSIIEMINLMYQNNTALNFLRALIGILNKELTERKHREK